MKDLFSEIKLQLYERTTSPLLGAFVISWCLWNYDFLLILISSDDPMSKLKSIEANIFSNDWWWIIYRVGGPLGTALAYIFLYPFPAQYVYRYTKFQHQKMKKIQQEAEDLTPLTIEESRKVWENSRSKVGKIAERLAEAEAEIERLEDALKAADSDRDEMSQKLQSVSKNEEIRLQPEVRKFELPVPIGSIAPKDPEDNSNDVIKKAFDKKRALSEDKKLRFTNISFRIMATLAKNGTINIIALTNKLEESRHEMDYILGVLEELGLIDATSSEVYLREDGNKYIVENDVFK